MADETPKPSGEADTPSKPRTAAEKRRAIAKANAEARATDAAKAVPDTADTPAPEQATNAEAKPEPKADPKPDTKPEKKPSAASTTASDLLGDVKAGVTGASKREPYALFAVIAFAGVILWLLWYEDDAFGFWGLRLWTIFILASAVMLFAPMVRGAMKLTEERAFQICAGGAFGLCFAWIAFLLPDISSNKAFFGTIATACAGLAAWMAPGCPSPQQD